MFAIHFGIIIFLSISSDLEDAILKYITLCENSIANRQPQGMVENTSNIARLANRVLGVAKQEADNSEDPNFISNVNRSADNLQRCK